MSKVPLLAATTALTAAFLLGVGTTAAASPAQQQGPEDWLCYYSGTVCVFLSGAMYTNCDPDQPQGWAWHTTAARNCSGTGEGGE